MLMFHMRVCQIDEKEQCETRTEQKLSFSFRFPRSALQKKEFFFFFKFYSRVCVFVCVTEFLFSRAVLNSTEMTSCRIECAMMKKNKISKYNNKPMVPVCIRFIHIFCF